MKFVFKLLILFVSVSLITSCISKKDYDLLQTELATANKDLGKLGQDLNEYMNRLSACEQENEVYLLAWMEPRVILN